MSSEDQNILEQMYISLKAWSKNESLSILTAKASRAIEIAVFGSQGLIDWGKLK